MASNVGFGKRLGERLREMGYWPEGREQPDYTRFGIENGHPPSAVYRWLRGEVPRPEAFLKLCDDIKRRPHYMLTGIDVPAPTPGMSIPDYIGVLQKDLKARAKARKGKPAAKLARPIAGGSGEADGLHVVQVLERLLLIGRWASETFRRWAWSLRVIDYAA